ncbi:MAG: hypothetical protein ACYTG1_08630 [Planctomycetota bacterium]
MPRTTRPLFRPDPGWLFIAAGLALCAGGILTPAQHELAVMRTRLRAMYEQEAFAAARLRAYARFLDDLEGADAVLVSRLAAAQLNMVPRGHRPVILTSPASARVTDWIETSVEAPPDPPPPPPQSRLTRLASGPRRLWLFAAGILCVFTGLVLGPGPAPPERVVRRRRLPPAVVHALPPAVSAGCDVDPAEVRALLFDDETLLPSEAPVAVDSATTTVVIGGETGPPSDLPRGDTAVTVIEDMEAGPGAPVATELDELEPELLEEEDEEQDDADAVADADDDDDGDEDGGDEDGDDEDGDDEDGDDEDGDDEYFDDEDDDDEEYEDDDEEGDEDGDDEEYEDDEDDGDDAYFDDDDEDDEEYEDDGDEEDEEEEDKDD